MPKIKATKKAPRERRGLTTQDLERVTCACDDGDCDNRTIYFHGKCHPSSPTEVRYTKGSGLIEILCAECKSLISEVAVASGPKASEIYTALEDEWGPPH